MFKNLLFCFIGLVFVLTAKAQPPNYTFQALTGTYAPISGGTSVVLTYNGAANYDAIGVGRVLQQVIPAQGNMSRQCSGGHLRMH